MSASYASLSRSRRLASTRLLALICMLGLLSTGAFAAAQPPTSAAAPVTCATCHVGVATHYATAPMRHAMEPQGANPVLTSHPNLTAKIGNYSYSVQTKDGQSAYTVSDSADTMTLPIRWIFGQQSQTWVLEKNGLLYESLVSYFPRDNALATTPGDQRVTPTNLTEAMGRELSVWESRSCFNCHATGVVPSENDFCGQCHRTWDTVVRNHSRGPAFVRFQPYRLGNSKCFIGNDKRISCLACHDPHQPVNHDQTYYDSKCLACHTAAKTTAAPAVAKVCPVSKNNCTTCHMPKIELPGGHAQFTDHQIRIARAGDPYPN